MPPSKGKRPKALPGDRRLGNRFWEARSRHGRLPIFKTPQMLEEACLDYFKWVEDNPLWEDTVMSYQGEVKHVPVAHMRAMTIDGLCIFLDIIRSTWDTFRVRQGFSDIVTRTEATIRSQKFAGAAADLLNANIIARDLGLAEKSEERHIYQFDGMSDDAIEKLLTEALGQRLAGPVIDHEPAEKTDKSG